MTCIAAMTNMTAAMKGKSALEKAGISCTIVNLEPTLTARGCAYGIRFQCVEVNTVTSVLNRKNIEYGEILGNVGRR